MQHPKRNKYAREPEAELDLHGHTAFEAREALRAFLEEAQHRKLHTVRLVVGKGTHSAHGPVLPDVAKVILREYGLSYTYGKVHEGGEGALVVSMR